MDQQFQQSPIYSQQPQFTNDLINQVNTENTSQQQPQFSQPTFNNQSIQTPEPVVAPPTLEDKLKQYQDKWTNEITELNNMMKTLPRLDDLLNIVYTKRQEAVDYYHSMNSIILKQTKDYKLEFNTICTNIRVSGLNGIRMQNDTAITKHVEGVLIEKKLAIELLANHNTYIKETIQTIDNMIYGINQKIKLAEILNGLKF